MAKLNNSFFAASNSSNGFVSYFEKIFSPESLDKIYIIKGGPGTGKSYLMRYIGKKAEQLGYTVEYFLCSSDTNSLDGILITELKTAMIDGTAPHMTDPIYPGAVEEIINLGEFFDISALTLQKDKIMGLIHAKKELYRRAYAFLGCAGSMRREKDEAVSPYVLYKKLTSYVNRLCAHISNGCEYKESTRITHAFGTNGEVYLETFYENAQTHYLIKDVYGTSYILFSSLLAQFKEKKLAVTISYCPDTPEKIDGLYLDDLKISFTIINNTVNKDDKIINMARFLNRDGISAIKRRIRFMENAYQSVISEALVYLNAVKALHAETEDIYISSMNFEKKERLTRKLAKTIFKEV